MILFLLYYSSTHIFTTMIPYVLGVGLIIAPWFIVRSVAFNCRYSAYRNITFCFKGSYKEAFKIIYSWGIIPAITIGTIFNWWGQYWFIGIVYVTFCILFPWWLRRLKNFIVTKTSYGGNLGQFSATGKDFFKIYLVSVLIAIVFSAITTFIVIGLIGTEWTPANIAILLPIYSGYVYAYAYVQAKITNTVWNKISLGPLRFHCTLSSFDMVILYLTNAIGIIVSAGLLIPWAVIRTYKYRIDNTHVFKMAELNEFRASETENVQAAGAEMTEFFDMDLSI